MTSALSTSGGSSSGQGLGDSTVGLSNGATAAPMFDHGATTEMADVSPPADTGVGFPGGVKTFAGGMAGAALHSKAMKGDNAYARSVDKFSERAANKVGKSTTPDPKKFGDLSERAKGGDKSAQRTLDRYGRSNPSRYNRLNRMTNNASRVTGLNKTASRATVARAGTGAARAGRLGMAALRLAPMAAAALGPWGLVAGAVVLAGIAMFSSETFRTWVTGGIRPSGIGANDPPAPPETHFLPMPEDSRDETVVPVDTRLTYYNDTITDIDPQAHRLWDLDSPGVTSLSRMTPVSDQINDISSGIDKINEQFSTIYSGSQSTSNVVADSAHAMKPFMEHLSDFGTQAGEPMIRATLDAAKTGNGAFQAIRDANAQSRQAIAESQGKWLGVVGGGHIKGTDMTDNADTIEQNIAQLREQTNALQSSTQAWAEAQPEMRSDDRSGGPGSRGGGTPEPLPDQQPRRPLSPGPSPVGSSDPGGSGGSGSDGGSDEGSGGGLGDPITPEDTDADPVSGDDPAGEGLFGGGGEPLDTGIGSDPGLGLGGEAFGDPLGGGPGELGADIGSGPLEDPFGSDDFSDPATATSSETDPWGAGDLDDIWGDDNGLETDEESSDGFGVADDAADDPFGDPATGDAHDGGAPLEDGGPAGGASEGGSELGGEGAFDLGDDPAGEPGGAGPDVADDLANESPWGDGGDPSGEEHPERMVSVGSEEREFLNEPTAAMATDILDESVQTPESFQELAASHGLELPGEGNDIGAAISPAEMQPGDVLVSEGQTYMYVGGEEVVDPATGQTLDVADVANFGGEHEGVFRLDAGDGEVTYSGGSEQAEQEFATPSSDPSQLTSDSASEGGASTSSDQGRDGGFERTDTAPIGLGDGQSVPGAGGDQDQPQADPASGGISEVPYEGEPLGGSDASSSGDTTSGQDADTSEKSAGSTESTGQSLGPVEAEHDPEKEFGGSTSSTPTQNETAQSGTPEGARTSTGALDPNAIN